MRRKTDTQRLPDCTVLEDRVLMSASPLMTPEAADTSQLDLPDHLFAPLSAGDSLGDSLSAIPIPAVVLSEDPNNYTLQLDEYFDLGGSAPDEITYTLIANTNDELFEEITINPENSNLTLDIAGDQFGEAILTLRATDEHGVSADNTFQLTVNPHNDRPTTSGFSDLVLDYGTNSTVIDLFAAFDDVEDADEDLRYEVVSLSNAGLFESVTIDAVAGTLTLEYAQGATGSSDILLRATDTEGLAVEMSTAGRDFRVYNWLTGDVSMAPNIGEWGLTPHTTLTSGVFFDDGAHPDAVFNPDRLAGVLDSRFPVGFNEPVIFNIEIWDTEIPEQRDKLVEVIDFAREYRPDLEFGYYRLFPERNWHAPVAYQRGLDEVASGNLTGYYARNLDNGLNFRNRYLNWVERNEAFRTEEVSASLGGGTVADRLDHVSPSLYTFYRTGDELWADPQVENWDIYAEYNIAEARKFNVPVNVFLSPSIKAIGVELLEKDFFRHQLQVGFELGDSITIYSPGDAQYAPENRGWLEALDEFMQYIQTPTGFTVTVQAQDAPTGTTPPPLILTQGMTSGQIDLWSAFHDPNHADPQLNFSVVDTVNGDNFSQLEVDALHGGLTFELAPGARGISELVVRATDPDGWVTDVTFTVALPTLTASASFTSHGFETAEDMLLQLGDGTLPVPAEVLDGPDHSSQFQITDEGALTYLPRFNFYGSDYVRYETSLNELIEVHFEVTSVNDAPIAAASPTYNFDLVPSWLAQDIDISKLFIDVDHLPTSLELSLVGFDGNVVQSVEINRERMYARIMLTEDGFGSSDVTIQARDPAGGTATNHFTIVRNPVALTDPDQGAPSVDLFLEPGQGEMTQGPSDPQHLFAASGLLTKTQANQEGEITEDDDEDLVAVPLLSLQGSF